MVGVIYEYLRYLCGEMIWNAICIFYSNSKYFITYVTNNQYIFYLWIIDSICIHFCLLWYNWPPVSIGWSSSPVYVKIHCITQWLHPYSSIIGNYRQNRSIVLATHCLLPRIRGLIPTQDRNIIREGQTNTESSEFIPCSNDVSHIPKSFNRFKVPATTFIWPKSLHKHNVTPITSQRHEKLMAIAITIVTSSKTFLSLYISRWWCQARDTCIYVYILCGC